MYKVNINAITTIRNTFTVHTYRCCCKCVAYETLKRNGNDGNSGFLYLLWIRIKNTTRQILSLPLYS